ncbi:hypothetical protein HYPSUDRAFT_40849 [Hypholoma sublateritium FD-334 SS-4]|uniref:DUF1996 domain-containing protein n=1 Tax=Hypholoma sublateritium (strain FD-334 SS-4) TaxID=945553 RepID=A0A0D2P190_HYPSF|nr:hypothetical protein HYPSUDRAFT_40849 [Hypholoma sublateritium FD-334 SS-4]
MPLKPRRNFFARPALLTLFLGCNPAAAWFRVPCSTTPVVEERLDPIVSPGISPSNHVHTVHGSNMFSANSTYNLLRNSSCSNCQVAQDASNYWFAKLYLHDPQTGQYESVPNGGLLVYYENRGSGDVSNGGPGLKAFPPGLKMISGDPTRRSRKYTPGEGSQGELAERAIEWECLRYTSATGYNSAAAGSGGFPTTDCEDGLNSRIHLPACWDGVNLDSSDHVSHTAFLSDLDNGDCPSTHPVPLMKLLYEVTWDVHSLASRWNPSKEKWPFVWSTGDPTGYSWHGDFQNGWDTTALQNAIDQCNNPNNPTGSGVTEACSFLTVVNATLAGECQIPPTVNEIVNGNMTSLPGCNPLQFGPADAILRSPGPDCLVSTGKSVAHGNYIYLRGALLAMVWAVLALFALHAVLW